VVDLEVIRRAEKQDKYPDKIINNYSLFITDFSKTTNNDISIFIFFKI